MKIYQVDSFTKEPFRGNPAAVCLFVESETSDWMQSMAREMNLSETAFLKKRENGCDLRWFTPNTEVDLCGHGTLAAAHVLWESGELALGQEAVFYTKSGILRASKRGDWIQLDFPLEEEEEVDPPPELVRGLNVPLLYVGRNRMDYLVEVESETVLQNLSPNLETLAKLGDRGVMVTSQADSDEYDFVSRFFAPTLGIPEDPVTGSAHCCLGPYWKRRLGRDEFVAYQASKRGGVLRVEVKDRIYLHGQARTVFCGELHCS